LYLVGLTGLQGCSVEVEEPSKPSGPVMFQIIDPHDELLLRLSGDNAAVVRRWLQALAAAGLIVTDFGRVLKRKSQSHGDLDDAIAAAVAAVGTGAISVMGGRDLGSSSLTTSSSAPDMIQKIQSGVSYASHSSFALQRQQQQQGVLLPASSVPVDQTRDDLAAVGGDDSSSRQGLHHLKRLAMLSLSGRAASVLQRMGSTSR
jgi:hypothetical protein